MDNPNATASCAPGASSGVGPSLGKPCASAAVASTAKATCCFQESLVFLGVSTPRPPPGILSRRAVTCWPTGLDLRTSAKRTLLSTTSPLLRWLRLFISIRSYACSICTFTWSSSPALWRATFFAETIWSKVADSLTPRMPRAVSMSMPMGASSIPALVTAARLHGPLKDTCITFPSEPLCPERYSLPRGLAAARPPWARAEGALRRDPPRATGDTPPTRPTPQVSESGMCSDGNGRNKICLLPASAGTAALV
mmetsp:Transcript_60527/g.192126  ORF Transcript_60527/g.192126 Transcript_60527/m.192126 type:complete len:253 (-) Transcript_60527:83-841(-)